MVWTTRGASAPAIAVRWVVSCVRQPMLPLATTAAPVARTALRLALAERVRPAPADRGCRCRPIRSSRHRRSRRSARCRCAPAGRAARARRPGRAAGGRRRGRPRSAARTTRGAVADAERSRNTLTSTVRAASAVAAAASRVPSNRCGYSFMPEPQPAAVVTTASTSSGNAARLTPRQRPGAIAVADVQRQRAAAALRRGHDHLDAVVRQHADRRGADVRARAPAARSRRAAPRERAVRPGPASARAAAAPAARGPAPDRASRASRPAGAAPPSVARRPSRSATRTASGYGSVSRRTSRCARARQRRRPLPRRVGAERRQQIAVLHARRARRHAGQAAEAAIDVRQRPRRSTARLRARPSSGRCGRAASPSPRRARDRSGTPAGRSRSGRRSRRRAAMWAPGGPSASESMRCCTRRQPLNGPRGSRVCRTRARKASSGRTPSIGSASVGPTSATPESPCSESSASSSAHGAASRPRPRRRRRRSAARRRPRRAPRRAPGSATVSRRLRERRRGPGQVARAVHHASASAARPRPAPPSTVAGSWPRTAVSERDARVEGLGGAGDPHHDLRRRRSAPRRPDRWSNAARDRARPRHRRGCGT